VVAEIDLPGHLTGGDEELEVKVETDNDADSSEEEPLVKRDYALYEALNLLKGLSIIVQRN
jgi:carboxyl-terminal processing protease